MEANSPALSEMKIFMAFNFILKKVTNGEFNCLRIMRKFEYVASENNTLFIDQKQRTLSHRFFLK